MLRQQMADIKDACQKAGWEKVKAMQNAEKQGKDQSNMGTDVVHVLFLVLKIRSRQRKASKRNGR